MKQNYITFIITLFMLQTTNPMNNLAKELCQHGNIFLKAKKIKAFLQYQFEDDGMIISFKHKKNKKEVIYVLEEDDLEYINIEQSKIHLIEQIKDISKKTNK